MENMKYDGDPVPVYHSQLFWTSYGPIKLIQTNIRVTKMLLTAHTGLYYAP